MNQKCHSHFVSQIWPVEKETVIYNWMHEILKKYTSLNSYIAPKKSKREKNKICHQLIKQINIV